MTLTSYPSFSSHRGAEPTHLYLTTALSKYAQNAFAIRICSGVRQFGSNICGVPTRMHTHRARDVATFRRWRLRVPGIALLRPRCAFASLRKPQPFPSSHSASNLSESLTPVQRPPMRRDFGRQIGWRRRRPGSHRHCRQLRCHMGSAGKHGRIRRRCLALERCRLHNLEVLSRPQFHRAH